MKKRIAFILTLVCILAMAACGQEPVEDDGNVGISAQPPIQRQPAIHACEELAQYLDHMHFVPQLSQGDLMDQMEQYTYNGKTALELSQGVFYDGPHGGGFDGSGELCGFHNSYQTTEDGQCATYANSMYTRVPLEGLELPLGITFDDTLQTVLHKLQLDADPQSIQGTRNLCSDGDTVIALTTNELLPSIPGIAGETENLQYACRLEYTQTYETTRGDIDPAEVTRMVTMYFKEGSGRLAYFEMSVKERYKRNSEEIPGAKIHLVEIRDTAEEEQIPCDSAMEKFWEDEENAYYFPCVKSRYVYAMDSTGMCFDIITALNQGLAAMESLDTFGIEYITIPKQ